MKRNLICDALPQHVLVGGKAYSINTDFRAGIRATLIFEANYPDQVKASALLKIYFVKEMPTDIEGAISAITAFYSRDELTQSEWSPKQLKRVRVDTLDYDYDADNLVSDFMREYKIDLTDKGLYMHWWRFVALLHGLSDDSLIKTVASYRAWEPEQDDPKEYCSKMNKVKRAFLLPPRTRQEAIERAEQEYSQ